MKAILAVAMAAGALCMTAPASADPGYANARVNVRAGPSSDFPRVGALGRGVRIEVRGCITDRSWCDVSWRLRS